MARKKILKKRELRLDDIEGVVFTEEASKDLTKYDPADFFRDHTKIAKALLQCLVEGDDEAYKEILDAYLRVNRLRVAQKTQLSRTTVQNAFSSRGNPTLRTIAKIVHHQASEFSNLKDSKLRFD
jgi:probable addiction module antidote protein